MALSAQTRLPRRAGGVSSGSGRMATFLSSLLVATSCGGGAASDGSTSRYRELPNIVLVTVDTLRADHLGCYGYYRDTSPHIDALATRSVFFERAIATAATTLPSHLSILTGLYPHQHGFVANKGAIKHVFASKAGSESIAAVLRAGGYETAAFVSGTTVKRTTGIDAGFETFDQPEAMNRLGADTTDLALAWLAAPERTERPFFLWVHYWDPHEPNDPPEPWASRFETDDALDGLIARRRIDPDRLQSSFETPEIARMFHPDLYAEMWAGEKPEVPPVTMDDVRRLLNAYDADVAYTDECIGRLLARVDVLGGRPTVIALTADHGQALGQHAWLEHGRVHDENLHVPLMIAFPELDLSARVERVISLIDLFPTILARIDAPFTRAFLEQAEGLDALAAEFDRPYAFSHRAERERDWEPGRKFTLTFGRWKYHYLEQGPDELYDLVADPGELENVALQHPDKVDRLGRLVRHLLRDRPAGEPVESQLTDAERATYEAELRALGYLGDDEE